MIVQRHGGATNRAGTPFLNEVKDSTKVARLVKYVYNASQTYVLEFGDFYMRVFKLGARVSVAGVAAWNGATAYVVGDLVLSGGINYYCVQAHTNHVPPNGAFWYALTGAIYEIPTPYAAADLATIDFVQSANVITLVHPTYAPQELKRTADTTWTMTPAVFAPAIDPPPVFPTPTLTGGGAGSTVWWAITAIASETFEESLPIQTIQTSTKVPSAATPTQIAWTAATGAQGYYIYRSNDATSFGLVGFSLVNSFTDSGYTPDFLKAPPVSRNPFPGAGDYPSAVAYYQQRRVFASTNNKPETIWGSRSGLRTNFTTSFPLQDDDAVTFSLVGQKVNQVKHLLDLGRLIVFTSAEEKMVEGDQAGILRPDAINPRKLSANGSGSLKPIELDDSALYLQARGTKVRDFKPVSADYYEGTDLTIFAAHLFDGYTLVDWDYAQNPHSIIWAVRSDGALLGLTYFAIRRSGAGTGTIPTACYENVCVVPEGSEDAVYFVVRRTINGATKRYVERMASRFFTAVTDANFLDASVSIDGRNTGATTMAISGGVNWDDHETLTLTASVASFVLGDIGSSIFVTAPDGTEIEFKLEGLTSNVIMTGHVDKIVPVPLRGVATTTWAKAIKTVTGLAHLEAKSVAVFADGYVESSPNNNKTPGTVCVVAGGQITLSRPFKQIKVGLPFISDLETLDIDSAGASTIKDRKTLIGRVILFLEKSRGVFAGKATAPTAAKPVNGLQELKARANEPYGTPVSLITDNVEIQIESSWDSNGRVLVRQVDPLPLTVLSVAPVGYLPN
jgi:hypothetical protein